MERNTASYMLSRSLREMSRADGGVEDELDAHALDQLDFAVEHGLGQAVFGQGVAQHAARLGIGLVNGDFVAQQRQVERGGQAGGAGAHHGHFAIGGRQLVRRDARPPGRRNGRNRRWSRR